MLMNNCIILGETLSVGGNNRVKIGYLFSQEERQL